MGTRERRKLSVIIPCFNEEHTIEGCLKSVVWADEILVVDSFSTDTTLDIARRYTGSILQHEYGYSAAQKNWAIPRAQHEWVLIVDSDERVSPELRQEIENLLGESTLKDGYWVPRRNFLFGREIRHSGWGRDTVLRLFRRDLGRYQDKRVHAEVELAYTGVLSACLDHHTVPSLNSWVEKINRYSSWKARDKVDRGASFLTVQLVFRPVFRFFKDFVLRMGVLDGWRGFLIASMGAFSELVMAAKMIDLRFKR